MKTINTTSRSISLRKYHRSMRLLNSYGSPLGADFSAYSYISNIFGEDVRLLRFHHTSLARGYQPSGKYSIDYYCGRFGYGISVELPSNLSSCRSNRYHDIVYFIFKD